MQSIKKDNYIILRDEKDDAKEFANFIDGLLDQFKSDNLVIDILKYGKLTLDELLAYLKPSLKHYKNKKSFIIVNDTIVIDDVPEELKVVPTLQEAEDMIQMEEIERDLGF
ncbi:ribonuclease Z [Flavobacteriaceae bacterium 14752]|uniref:ribonuclease Z n=1 Tax=Mesohalobacter salilacus TaxID=2491711 RepID=UPI000F63A9B5|nr:ribonuclease Z [Flavobacteriaceae bacterium 14752]